MGDNDRVKDVIVVTERGGDRLSQIVKPPETEKREREGGNIAWPTERARGSMVNLVGTGTSRQRCSPR